MNSFAFVMLAVWAVANRIDLVCYRFQSTPSYLSRVITTSGALALLVGTAGIATALWKYLP